MTLCIAAAAEENGFPRIILASDLRGETEFAGAENTFKMTWLTKGWSVLFAGNVASARELIQTYYTALDDVMLDEANVYAELKRPAELQKRALCEHYVQMRLGIPYSDFLDHGKDSLSEATFQQTEFEIRELDLGCDLIAAGFPASKFPPVPHIFTITSDGTVCRRDNFAAIGTGSLIAEAVLFQRNVAYPLNSLQRTLYAVWEAMKLGRIAPGVGKLINIVVVEPPGHVGRMLTHKGATSLNELYEKYGPKELDALPDLDPDCLERPPAGQT